MTTIRIPMKDLVAQYRVMETRLDAALKGVLTAGSYILGPVVAAFEKQCAAYLGVKHAVGVASGTDALLIALKCLDVGPGDEVITTPFTFVASADVIVRLGATPVFADIEPGTLNLAPDAVAAAVTPKTKAVLPVHLYGVPADVPAIAAAAPEIPVVEDACQAMGSALGGRKCGGLGAAAAFSFFPTKNLGGFGDGGLISCDDDSTAERARRLRVHGAARKNFPEEIGYKSRLDAVQAACLSVKLERLDEWSKLNSAWVARYRAGLAACDGVSLLDEPATAAVAYHQFTVKAAMRDKLSAYLAQKGIASAPYYPIPIHLTKAFYRAEWKEGAFPRAEEAAREVLSLPLWPEMTAVTVDEVVAAVNDFYAI